MFLLWQWMCVNKRVLFLRSFTLGCSVMDLEHHFTVGRLTVLNKQNVRNCSCFPLTDLVLRGWVTTSSSLVCANIYTPVCCVLPFKVDLVSSLSNKVKFILALSCFFTELSLSENKERKTQKYTKKYLLGR